MDQQGGDLDGVVVMKDGSDKKSDSEESDSELSAFLLAAENVSEDDYSTK